MTTTHTPRPLTNEEAREILTTHGCYIDDENGPLAAKRDAEDSDNEPWVEVTGLTRTELLEWIRGAA